MMTMKIPVFKLDAFTDRRFTGNPAAVCPLDEWLTDSLLQNIAAENNLSETAFFTREKDGFHIRWFTPVTEVDLCGHATLATAAVIFEKLGYKLDRILFESRSGMLTVSRDGDLYVLNFPADKITAIDPPAELIESLGERPDEAYEGREDYLLVYDSEDKIAEIRPDFRKLGLISRRGVIITAPASGYDFVSRFFAPAAGIDEDPVTGSAHTTLTPYWSGRLSKKDMRARQISRRGGELYLTDKGDRVEISGRVAFYLEGLIEV